MEQHPQLNDHNKQEYPPMHTAEHLLNYVSEIMMPVPVSERMLKTLLTLRLLKFQVMIMIKRGKY